jgi:hypothetical protein
LCDEKSPSAKGSPRKFGKPSSNRHRC